MNTLTIFLYLADVLNNIQFVLTICTLALILLPMVIRFVCIACYNEEKPTSAKKPYPMKHGAWATAIGMTFLLIAALVPSKDTMYLMAGSEIGEAVVTSPEAKEVYNDIRSVIKSQIENLKGKPNGS